MNKIVKLQHLTQETREYNIWHFDIFHEVHFESNDPFNVGRTYDNWTTGRGQY